MRVVLHIGFHKTGTTYLQHVLDAQREVLRKHGLISPALGRDPGPALIRMLHEHVGSSLPNDQRTPRFSVAETLVALHRARADPAAETLLVSAEQLSTEADERHLSRLLEVLDVGTSDVRVLVYVRDPVSSAHSVAQQLIRRGETIRHLTDRPPRPRYRKKLRPFLATFGREQLDIRMFDQTAFIGGTLLTDFLAALDLGGVTLDLPRKVRANRSMSGRAAAVLDMRNRLANAISGGLATRARPRLTLKLTRNIPGDPFRLPDEAIDRLVLACRDDVAWLAQTLGREPFSVDGAPDASRQPQSVLPTAGTSHSAPAKARHPR